MDADRSIGQQPESCMALSGAVVVLLIEEALPNEAKDAVLLFAIFIPRSSMLYRVL